MREKQARTCEWESPAQSIGHVRVPTALTFGILQGSRKEVNLLGQHATNYVTFGIGEPEPATLEPVHEFLVVNPQQVQNRRLHVKNRDRALNDVEAIFVSGTVNMPRLDAGTSDLDREALAVVVTAVVVWLRVTLRVRRVADGWSVSRTETGRRLGNSPWWS